MKGVSEQDLKLIADLQPYVQGSPENMWATINAVRYLDAAGIAGDMVECGVYRGGHMLLARSINKDRWAYLFDTFDGMPEPGPEDLKHTGGSAVEKYERRAAEGTPWCKATTVQVAEAFISNGLIGNNLFIQGKVEDTLLIEGNLPTLIAFLRLDTDWYSSTKIELEVLWPRLVPGGIMVIDDYGFWLGARKAVDEYFAAEPVHLIRIDDTARMVIKCR